MVYVKSDKLYSPYFYVTPNYADNAGCATVVVTQATYIGAHTLLEPTITEQMLKEALDDSDFQTATSTDESVTYFIHGYFQLPIFMLLFIKMKLRRSRNRLKKAVGSTINIAEIDVHISGTSIHIIFNT